MSRLGALLVLVLAFIGFVAAPVSFGLGPGFIWFPEFAGGKLAVLGKWIHDFDATNRFKSDYGTLTVAWTF